MRVVGLILTLKGQVFPLPFINSNQLDPWTPLVWVCVLYLAITMSMSQLVNGLERRSDWGSDSGMWGRLSSGSSDTDGGDG